MARPYRSMSGQRRDVLLADMVRWHREKEADLAEKERLLDKERATVEQEVAARVHRVEEELVRDSARGYRTGNLEQVLAGEFDLY